MTARTDFNINSAAVLCRIFWPLEAQARAAVRLPDELARMFPLPPCEDAEEWADRLAAQINIIYPAVRARSQTVRRRKDGSPHAIIIVRMGPDTVYFDSRSPCRGDIEQAHSIYSFCPPEAPYEP